MTITYEQEVKEGKRFQFGKNWQNFLSVLDDERIAEAEKSLKTMLDVDNLENKSFLDIGSGSGLFSLAARRLGAKVYSFDYDPNSVACTQELKRRYFPEDSRWTIEQGSVLDVDYLKSLGQFDIVYSWGVLHHTGDMWKALENIKFNIADCGYIYIAIYNDQGLQSKIWLKIKQIYCSGIFGKILISLLVIPLYYILGAFIIDILRLKNPMARYTEYKKKRGMSQFYDWFDWLGGLPFEVAKTDLVVNFFQKSGFELHNIKNVGKKSGCNEYVFVKILNSDITSIMYCNNSVIA
jgi:2-polyprenyl-6-hydroxyphenyl methylase/3-demethylubiquinone-9 3-methyltransferase